MLQTGIFQLNSTGKTAHKSEKRLSFWVFSVFPKNWLLANMVASNAKMDG